MPRLSYPIKAFGKYLEENEPLDFCSKCWSIKSYVDYIPCEIDENLIDYNVDHPPYQHEQYHCESCGVLLEEEDN